MPDTASMPARIWAGVAPDGVRWCKQPTPDGTNPYNTLFIRADIVERMAEVLRKTKHWASTRCPVREETPDPCSLCGARVDGEGVDGVCKSAEAIFPHDLLTRLSSAINSYREASNDES